MGTMVWKSCEGKHEHKKIENKDKIYKEFKKLKKEKKLSDSVYNRYKKQIDNAEDTLE